MHERCFPVSFLQSKSKLVSSFVTVLGNTRAMLNIENVDLKKMLTPTMHVKMIVFPFELLGQGDKIPIICLLPTLQIISCKSEFASLICVKILKSFVNK